MITISVKGIPGLESAFKETEGALRTELRVSLSQLGSEVAAYVSGSLLSGQMLKIRNPDKGLRQGMRVKMFEGPTSVRVEVYPKPGSPLWMHARGMRPEMITVQKGMSRTQRKMLAWTGTEFKQRKRARIDRSAMGTYQRMHHLNKVPFMETTFAQWKDESRKRVEQAIGKAVSTYGPG